MNFYIDRDFGRRSMASNLVAFVTKQLPHLPLDRCYVVAFQLTDRVRSLGQEDNYTMLDANEAGLLHTAVKLAASVTSSSVMATAYAKLHDVVNREAAADPAEPLGLLTPREREVLVRVASGKSCREIATELGLCTKTVDSHRLNMMSKLKLKGNAQLVLWAIKHGLVTP